MFRKALSRMIIVSLLVTMIIPNYALAAGNTSLADDFVAKTSTQIVKKNQYDKDLLDVCFYPGNKKFYAVGKAGTGLISGDGNTWELINEPLFKGNSASIDFVDMSCWDNNIVIIGHEASTGKNYVVRKKSAEAYFSRVELTGISGSHQVQAVAISNDNVVVTTNTSSYYHSADGGVTWSNSVLHANSTGASAIAVDTYANSTGLGNFKVYNNSDDNKYTFDGTIGNWTRGQATQKFSTVNNIYRSDAEWVVLMNNGTSTSGMYLHRTDGSASVSNTGTYMMEAAYVRGAEGTKIIVGWKDNKAIIRSYYEPDSTYSNSPLYKLYEYTDGVHTNSWVGNGKLYGVDAGEIASGGRVYVAVGSSGSIYRSTDGYQFSPVAQELDSAAQIKHVIANDDNGSTPGQQVAITTDNRVYYSTDRGVTWTYAYKVALTGEVAALKFINQYTTQQHLFIATNEGSNAHSYQLSLPNVVLNGVVDFSNFTIRGATTNTSGIVYYGTNPTSGKVKVASQNSSGGYEVMGDKLSDGTTDTPTGDIQLMIDYQGNEKYAISGTKTHPAVIPISSYKYNVVPANGSGSVNGAINKAYKAWVQGNNRQVIMDASGYVRVFTSVTQSSSMYNDTLIFVGQGIPESANFDLQKLVFVNGMFAALGEDGEVYTSFDGIAWTLQSSLSSANYVDLAGSSNLLLLMDKNNTIHTVTMSYNPWTSNTVVRYPDAVINKPTGYNTSSSISVDVTSDTNATGNTVEYQWLVNEAGTEPQPLTGETSSSLSLSKLSHYNGVVYVSVDVTYSNSSKVDQPQSTRRYGGYAYAIPYVVDYSATSFTALEGYNATNIAPITVTVASRTSVEAVSGLQISSSNPSVVVAGALSASTLPNYNNQATAQLTIAPDLEPGTYTADITVSSTSSNLSRTQTITVTVTEPERYALSGTVDRDTILLAHDYVNDDAKVELTLNNTGNRDIEDVTVTLSDTQHFELTNVPTSIAQGVTTAVYMTPKIALQPGMMYIVDLMIESTVTPTITIPVQITVDETPRYDVTLTPVNNDVTIAPGYTDPTVGNLVVSIHNTGNRDLNDLAVVLSGDNASEFTLSTVTPSLSVGQSVNVTMTPVTGLTDGEYNAALTVTSVTNSVYKTQALKLTVTDVPVYNLDMSLSKNSLNLAHGYASSDGIIGVTLQNNGNTAVTPVVSVSHSDVFTVGTYPQSIVANSSGSFDLQVKENVAPGTYTVTLTINSEAGSLTETITVTVAPAPVYQLTASFDKTTLNLPHGYATGDGKFVLTASNTGNQNLNVTVLSTNVTNASIPLEASFWSNGQDGPKEPGVTATMDFVPTAGLASGTHKLAVTVDVADHPDQNLGVELTVIVAEAPSPTPTPSPSPTPTPSPSPSPTPTPTPEPGQPSNPTPSPTPAIIVVPESLSTSTTSTNANGNVVVTQQVDEQQLTELLTSATSGATVRLAQETDADIVKTELSGSLLQSLGNKQATVEVQTSNGTYKLPTDQLDLNTLAQQFGTEVAASDLQVTVNIAKSDEQTVQAVADAAASGKLTLVVPPVEFSVTVSYNGQTQEVTQYSEYVTREIPIPNDVDPQLITTAAVLDKDGSLRAVPTTLVLRDGKYYAVIKSLTNSVYTLIHNEVSFDDAVNHWSNAAVHDLANRLVLNGVNEHAFGPDKLITRAEFAAIIVRALGLPQDSSIAAFTDVQAGDWYAGAVAKASEYGLISGYEDGTFRPHATIKREEAFTMIARAMGLTGLEASISGDQASEVLAAFEDGSAASKWAASSVATVVRSGIVQGSNAELRPTGNITRAETAVIVRRLLIQARLIEE